MEKRLDNPAKGKGLSRRYPFHWKLITTAEQQFLQHSEKPAAYSGQIAH